MWGLALPLAQWRYLSEGNLRGQQGSRSNLRPFLLSKHVSCFDLGVDIIVAIPTYGTYDLLPVTRSF